MARLLSCFGMRAPTTAVLRRRGRQFRVPLKTRSPHSVRWAWRPARFPSHSGTTSSPALSHTGREAGRCKYFKNAMTGSGALFVTGIAES
jgi:hypothetical protein